MGTLTEDNRRLANYAGAYNAAQSAGNAVIWRLVSPGAYIVGFAYPTTRSVFDAVWALAIASLLIAAPTFFLGVRDASRDVTHPDQPHFGSCQTAEEEAEAVALPAEDVATAAVALPRRVALRTSTASRHIISKFVACIVCTLVSVIVLLPIGLATLGTLVNTGGSDGCLPDGTFAIPGNFNIWDPQYVLTLTVGFGRMSFAIAKFVDLLWDVIVGHGGQALLIWIAYKILTRYLVCLMEHDGVTTRTYTAVAFHTGSLEGAWMLMRDLARRKVFTIPRNLVMMVYVGIYLLTFPAVISAMTSYAPIGDAYVTFEVDSGDGSTIKTRPFEEFTLINQTAGTWTYRNMTNLTTAALQEKAYCTQTNYYRWGFSYLMLFILAVASSVFVVLLVLLKRHDGLVSSVYQTDCYTPGFWRSVMDLSSHARSFINEEDMEHLTTEKLEQKLNGTRMAFDKDDLAAVQSALAAAEETSNATDHVAGQADSGKKVGLAHHAEAVWRRRKRSKGFDVYKSLPAQYEGV